MKRKTTLILFVFIALLAVSVFGVVFARWCSAIPRDKHGHLPSELALASVSTAQARVIDTTRIKNAHGLTSGYVVTIGCQSDASQPTQHDILVRKRVLDTWTLEFEYRIEAASNKAIERDSDKAAEGG